MKEPTYRHTLIHAWNIVWEHKILWIFGFFAAFLGQMGLIDFVSKSFLAENELTRTSLLFRLGDVWTNRGLLFSGIHLGVDGWIWFAWLMLLVGILVTGIMVVAHISYGALIHSVAQYFLGKKEIKVHTAWHKGVAHFWKLFCLQIIKRFVLAIFITFVGLSIYSFSLHEIPSWLFTIFILVGLTGGMILSFLSTYAAGYIMIEEHSLGRSLVSSWKLFWNHKLVSLEVGTILLLTNIFITCLTATAVLFFIFEMKIVWALTLMTGSSVVASVGSMTNLLLLVGIVAFFGSLFSVFTTSAWTYLFMKMHSEGISSRILHLLHIKD